MARLTYSYCSTSIGQAQSSASQLTALIQQVLEDNLEMSQRIANLEMRTLGYTQSAAPVLTDIDTCRDDESITTMKIRNDAKQGADEQSGTTEEPNSNASKESTGIQVPTIGFTFDHDLNNSRPYARAMKRNSVWSAASSAIHTMGWSYLSGLSLADVSEISIIDLPISPQELWNGDHYILMDVDKKRDCEETLVPVMDGLPHRRDKSLKGDELTLYDKAQPKGDSVGLDLSDRQATKVLVAAGPERTSNGMNHRPGDPSPPHSIARSSYGTTISISEGERRRTVIMEKILLQHYAVFKRFLAQSLRDEIGNPRSNRGRDKISRLSPVQFEEYLSTDVYDELLRRQSSTGQQTNESDQVPPYLLPKDNYQSERNQNRQKLATIPPPRFQDLVTDVFYELERRFPMFAGNSISRVGSPAMSIEYPLESKKIILLGVDPMKFRRSWGRID